MIHILEHTLSHTIEDSVKLLPFLFFTYLLMELLEHTTGGKVQNKIKNAGKVGPLWGGLLGIMPQCGFSAAAASLYAGRVITVGTLLAVFLSTSDEMLPIFISEAVAPATIFKILGAKVCIAIISGFLAELVYVNVFKKKEKDMDIHVVCEEEHCSCEDGVLKSALKHTFKIFIYILLITFMLTFVIELIGEDQLAVVFQDIPVDDRSTCGTDPKLCILRGNHGTVSERNYRSRSNDVRSSGKCRCRSAGFVPTEPRLETECGNHGGTLWFWRVLGCYH